VAVGEPGSDSNGDFSGRARVFEWNGLDWIQLAPSIVGKDPFDLAGETMALSSNGHVVAVLQPTCYGRKRERNSPGKR
jgi:hypothetical protein